MYFNPHSPKGVTKLQRKILGRLRFQPTLPEGSDDKQSGYFMEQFQFQPTLPEGSDICEVKKQLLLLRFQPTLPEGSDGTTNKSDFLQDISTHTPRREWRDNKYDNI